MGKGPATRTFKTAKEFLRYLNPIEDHWGESPRDWLFRGQREAEWALHPSAWRKPKGDITAQESWEREQFSHFCTYSDAQALPIPNYRDAIWSSSTLPWNDALLRPALALAQHHGVPTRMLDWTRRPLVAAYFAANRGDLAKETTHIAVWAMRRRHNREELLARPGSPLELVYAPRAENSNLHLQSGLFTLARDASAGLHALRTHDALYRGRFAAPEQEAWLQKLLLPVGEVKSLLRMLHGLFVHGAAVKAGYDGARDAVQERAFFEST